MQKTSGIYRLEGTIQHYSWGGSQYIPALKGIGSDGSEPCAEYWMGAHDQSPSILPQGRLAELNRFIASNEGRLAHDAADSLTLLTGSRNEMKVVQEMWPKISFHVQREHAGLKLESMSA